MECQKCGQNPATIFLAQMINGKMQKIDLCEKCSKEMGVTSTGGFSLSKILMQVTKQHKHLSSSASESASEPLNACPQCGYTEHELRKSARLGCPTCYEVFPEVREIIREVQKKMHHYGKVPARQVRQRANQEELMSLQRELHTAIRKEKYEHAAWLRDQIRLLKESL